VLIPARQVSGIQRAAPFAAGAALLLMVAWVGYAMLT
jgi:hypothetical protein